MLTWVATALICQGAYCRTPAYTVYAPDLPHCEAAVQAYVERRHREVPRVILQSVECRRKVADNR